ncbi:transketolase [Nocardioides panacihumi]|uniref:Transketolase n=1 Tax=Nocardioides panacihumi TaxID=400774 RepID=A0ABN2RV92_9ACTN
MFDLRDDALSDPRWDLDMVGRLAGQLRVDAIRMSTRAGSGHPTSSMSAADLMAVLLARHLDYDWQAPARADNDHLIFSKGHASPLLYAMYKAAGVVSDDELMSSYRRPGSPWQGHPTPVLPWVDVATGSLGQGLPDAVGVALAGRYLDRADYRVWVLCGDSELAEGSMWEAFGRAADRNLSNLTAIVDINRLGMRGATELGWDTDRYEARVSAFGCIPIVVDGHDLAAVDSALGSVGSMDAPTVILARTVKGKGIPAVEDTNGWHGKPLPSDAADIAVRGLGGISNLTVPRRETARPRGGVPDRPEMSATATVMPSYEKGSKVATRTAYGQALVALGSDPRVVVVDAEVGNSTQADVFAEAHPDRYFDLYTAEQQMVAAAIGLSVRGYVPFAATFGAFLTRAYDFIRMAAISRADIRLAGSHAGVEIGPDGSSQMALEDLAMMRAVHGSTVLYPSDAVSTVELVRQMHGLRGVAYLRTTRGAYPVLYDNGEPFPVGGSKTLLSSDDDDVVLAGAGVTVHICLQAAESLALEGIRATVLDLYSIKPIDSESLIRAVRATGGRLVVVEDHHPEGGLGEAAVMALAQTTPLHLEHLAVSNMPSSGLPAELLAEAHLATPDVVDAVHRLVARSGTADTAGA